MILDNNIAGISGHITGVNLSSFLQMIEMEKKSCTIKVFKKKNLGWIFFLNGVLIDAETMDLKHLDALYDILSWEDVVIDLEKNDIKRPNAINLPLMHVLIESAQYLDETQRDGQVEGTNNVDAVSGKKIPTRILNNNNFCLELGIELLLNFDDLVAPFRSTLVGIEKGEYLILKAPGPIGSVDHDLFKVEDLIIKTLYKGTIYAFRSKVIDIVPKPSKLMFIEYPMEIEHHELRSHKRFKCNILAQPQLQEKERDGVIKNISKGGCLCVMETFSTDQDLSSTLLNNTIPFRCRFPGSKGEISFTGEIRNTNKMSDKLGVGVQFNYPEQADEVKAIINDYIQLIEYSSENV